MKIYETRYKAKKENPGNVVVKVDGGFIAMTYSDYATFRRQK